jgi:hypothetical protein
MPFEPAVYLLRTGGTPVARDATCNFIEDDATNNGRMKLLASGSSRRFPMAPRFQSPQAQRYFRLGLLSRYGFLGFLGMLGFLGFLPGCERLLGMFGFSGLSGMFGFAGFFGLAQLAERRYLRSVNGA